MTSLRFYASLRTLLRHARRCGIPLPEEGETSLTALRMSFDALVASFLVYKIVCSSLALFVIRQFEVKLYVFSIIAYFFTGLFIILFFVVFRERFASLVAGMDDLTARLEDSGLGRTSILTASFASAGRQVSLFARAMSLVSVLCPCAFCLSVPFFDYLEGRYRSRTAVAGQCPFEFVVQQLPGVFELIVLQQVLGFFFPSSLRYSIEGLMLGFFKIQSSYFVYLSVTLEDIGKRMDSGSNDVGDFLKWIKLHQRVITNAYELSSFFSPVIVVYYFSTIIAVAGPLIYMLDTKSANFLQTFFGAMAMITGLLQLYLQCHAANEITTEGEKIAVPAYSMPWPGFGGKTRDWVSLIINMANRPIHVDGYRCPAFRLNRITYQALFLNTVSTFMAFRKIQEMNELKE